MAAVQPAPHADHIKGAAFREFLVWYSSEYDALRLDRALASLPASERAHFDLSASGYGVNGRHWYPAEPVHHVLDELFVDVPPEQMRKIAEAAARHVMRANLTGIYQFAFSVIATPERFAQHAQRLWSLYYGSGQLRYESTGPQSFDIHYRGWAGHHPVICWLNMASAVPIFEIMGCEDVQWDRHACVSDGDHHCRSSVSWGGGQPPFAES